ncbi:coenzyme PQQ synthesis protein E [Rhizocola hellebori]|uniref:PqqA peptide cyclase n=1 Tax=Rhizocola hellebori TaxID=1392758 RepID=A0A8J3VH14_9ACTN|nr:pyrroloquinoline quinone biosynthesis protein PqqE [Rhizocola hellebori]GIH06939.1 coenzyme PQQ synthesis protein E [Rhizocola hellebori]
MNRYGVARGVRLEHDPIRGSDAILYPEGVLLVNETAGDIVRLCDGTRTGAQIAQELGRVYEGVTGASVASLLDDLVARRILVADGSGAPAEVKWRSGGGHGQPRDPVPVGLLAELTYRCPLRCTYCANPVSLSDYAGELNTAEWQHVFEQARRLGVLQLHLSGGEPLLRRDLPELLRHARALGMYTNLITSGIPLAESGLAALADAGLDHFQLSIQDSEPDAARAVAGIDAHQRKLSVAAMVRRAGLPLTVNVVLHAGNVGRLAAIAQLAVEMGADRLELAHTQYYGWALRNRAVLMPSPAQIEAATEAVEEVRQRFGEAVEIVYVLPDYHTGSPKPCMNGWGSRQLVVAPNGDVLPCLAAAQLPDLETPSVRRETLAGIWYGSRAFNRFRGTDWLPEPCHSCALREVDFGGCRCQAFQITGDATATDPACRLSPHHHLLQATLLPGPAKVAVPRRLS